jgi:predicted DsbA family dithiol-disulfide isomerase
VVLTPRDDAPAAPASRRRRALLIGGGAALLGAGWLAAPPIRRWLASGFEFEPLADPEGFRRIAGGATSGGFDPLVGLNEAEPAALDPDSLRPRLCATLFGATPAQAGVVPVASFSDYNCPYCRVLTKKLADIEAASKGGVRVAWHEWPLLGQTSEDAARAALAAKRQGAYVGFHERLMGSAFVATEDYLRVMSEDLGVDADRLLADMESPAVARELAESRALAELFAFAGTPALVVGRTVVNGAVSGATLEALIAREREDGPPPACA